jgi:transposase-like protein
MENIVNPMQSTKEKGGSPAGGQSAPTEPICPPAGLCPEPVNFSPPDPEVTVNKARRIFTAKYKLRILEEVDACTESGQIGAVLRREGLYSSNLTSWRRQRENGILDAMTPKKRGCHKKMKNPLANELARLENENRQLREKLRKAEVIIDVQKKISDLLTLEQNMTGNGRSI